MSITPISQRKPIMRLVDVCRTYSTGEGALEVLKGANLELRPGEMVGLVGPSGSGKSTLLHTAGLLESPDSGLVEIDDVDAARMSERERTLTRRKKLGFVYQFHHLLPELNAIDNVAAPLMIDGVNRKIARERASKLLQAMGLSERERHQPGQLSGGEQQRVAIARSLANQPRVLIADEPTGNLDPMTTTAVFQSLFDTARTEQVAVLVATHNLELTTYMDRVLTLKDGQLTDADI
ncbi:ABC transporter ATP-binding protein [Hirschia baltica]|uniref:ABC transporter related n=1 Tax=Hirschia baltica (strain ATCC 49814 / DSM 5838 / IFAM 1418) TaxID=582402 RepID=C6XJW2_HIRBI|nr:ABC transporter ATP-binding protein [Hirschia baltica]ACT59407.1 ABC transporter related [Hirschia baltica ATCC 49814]